MSHNRNMSEKNFSENVKEAFKKPESKIDYNEIKIQNDCFKEFFAARNRYYANILKKQSNVDEKIPMMEDFQTCRKAFKSNKK